MLDFLIAFVGSTFACWLAAGGSLSIIAVGLGLIISRNTIRIEEMKHHERILGFEQRQLKDGK